MAPLTFGGPGVVTYPPIHAGSTPSVEQMLQEFLHYLVKCWLPMHPMRQEAQALATFRLGPAVDGYRAHRASGRSVPVDEGLDLAQSHQLAQVIARRPMHCLLNSTVDVGVTSGMRVTALPPDELVEKVLLQYPSQVDVGRPVEDQLRRWGTLSPSLTALVHDGRTGHCVLLRGVERRSRSVIFWDPWPLRSLLCSENNDAGVGAVQVPSGEFLWMLDRESLGAVLCAVFVAA